MKADSDSSLRLERVRVVASHEKAHEAQKGGSVSARFHVLCFCAFSWPKIRIAESRDPIG